MKKTTTLLLLLSICVSNICFGQEKDSLEFKRFKKFLPYVIKGIQDEKQSNDNINEKTAGLFNKPWLINKLDIQEAENIATSLASNNIVSIEKNHSGIWNLDIFSILNTSISTELTSASIDLLPNIFVEILDTELNDSSGNSVIDVGADEKNIKSSFNNRSINLTIPLNGEYKNVNGTIDISINEFVEVFFKEFKKVDKNIKFNLGKIDRIELIKIEKNRAYLLLPSKLSEIEIIPTNKVDEIFSEKAKLTVPKTIYEFSKNKNLTDESIKNFVNDLSYDDAYNNEQIVVIETNGVIENLYVFIKSNSKRLSKATMEIKL
ncbi:hypothetical protein I2486_00665 [Cellulophaga sp. E16_2]|uniref:hypothetical protein n=1 Tax=Cellulophaga sp. E16_2 TaxID=2789297 RepID=UPI001A911011|nr:hypothetical protein [Cellulophaga sp. E16_2]MBO0589906.1 hypothetical protein [Cellulophaga sp. E16_2]